ncbi:MAG: adenosylmethionine decarboxylase [Armatimonadota bacterium]
MSVKREHVLIDLWFDGPDVLLKVEPTRSIMRRALRLAGAKVLHERFHQFEPHGFSGVFIIAESHASAHTWVEDNFMAVDLLSCGSVDWKLLLEELKRGLRPARQRVRCELRG